MGQLLGRPLAKYDVNLSRPEVQEPRSSNELEGVLSVMDSLQPFGQPLGLRPGTQ